MESLDSHEFHGKVENCLMWRYPTFAGFADLTDLFLAHLRAAGKHGACFTSRREQVPRSEGAVIRRLDFIAPKLAPCPGFFFLLNYHLLRNDDFRQSRRKWPTAQAVCTRKVKPVCLLR